MPLRRALCFLLLLPALLLGAPARAQQIDPAFIARGYLQSVQGMTVTMDGNALQLAAGGIIRNQKNLIVVPTAIPSGGAWVDYVLDKNGQIFRAWMLTADELSQPPRPRSR